jgi:hypothetical protein
MVVILRVKDISAVHLLLERSNAGPELRLEAGARDERTL